MQFSLSLLLGTKVAGNPIVAPFWRLSDGLPGSPGGLPPVPHLPERPPDAGRGTVLPSLQPARGVADLLAGSLGDAWIPVLPAVRHPSTGQSLGKKAVGIYVIKRDTGEFLGGWVGIGRQLLHIVDYLPLCLGFIVGLFNTRTFADMIVGSTVVARPRTPQLPPPPPLYPVRPPKAPSRSPSKSRHNGNSVLYGDSASHPS